MTSRELSRGCSFVHTSTGDRRMSERKGNAPPGAALVSRLCGWVAVALAIVLAWCLLSLGGYEDERASARRHYTGELAESAAVAR